MNQKPKQMPKGFLWGAATSAYQVEGAAAEDGKKLSQMDVLNQNTGFSDASIASCLLYTSPSPRD